MRFDPQANFVEEDQNLRSVMMAPPIRGDQLPPGVSVRSPLKTALVILALGFLGGGGYWAWNEGLPGIQPKAAAEAPVSTGAGSGVVLFAEALISGEVKAELTGAADRGAAEAGGGSGRMSASQRRTRVQEEYEAGRSLMAIGRHAEAVPHFAEAVRLDPEHAEARYRLGLAYVQSGDLKSAKLTRWELAKLDTHLANLLAHLIEN